MSHLVICQTQPASINVLQNIFNTIISSFIENKVGVAEGFLSVTLANHLKENLIHLHKTDSMQNAGTGNDVHAVQNKLVRSDKIYWLDKKNNNQYENEFFDLMDSFILYLNRECYTGITGYEFHYTLYEVGSFYKKHKDQFRNNDSRQYSIIMYLNADWKLADAGELCIQHIDYEQTIAPTNGKMVFFKSSEMEHEVLPTNAPRMSITGWLKRD